MVSLSFGIDREFTVDLIRRLGDRIPIGRGKPDLTDFVVDGLEPSDRVPRHEALSEARSSSTAD